MSRSVVVRKVLALCSVFAAFAVALVVTAATPASASSESYSFLSKVNASRQANGLKPLTMRSDLVNVAYNWTKNMASKDSLAHNPNLTSQVKNWQAVGENVGVGPDVKSIQDAFMNSAKHRANILDRDFTEAGFATVRDSKGQLWVTQVFRQPYKTATTTTASKPTTQRASTPAAPRTTTVTAPRPVTSRPVVVRNPLAERLAQLSKAPATTASDPLARAFSYVSTMAALTG